MAGTLSIETNGEHTESLFLQLFGGRSHIEVNLSNAFAMCFRESPPFADAVIRLLYMTCRLRGSPRAAKWHCAREVSMSKGRPDIEIHAPGVARFRLESKVGAALTKQQLRNYRCQNKREYLIAVTKRAPEVSRKWMRRQGVFAIRWQDVHRAVASARMTGRDRYLRDSFCLYLEELGMAHREDVRPADLQRLYELFETIASSNRKWKGVTPRNAFDVGESCLHLLREVARDVRDEVPKFQNWARRGPMYSKNRDTKGNYWHHLGFHFRKQRNDEMVGAGFSFLQDHPYAKWEVWRQQPKGLVDQRMSDFKKVCGKAGALDRSKMLHSFLQQARNLGLKV